MKRFYHGDEYTSEFIKKWPLTAQFLQLREYGVHYYTLAAKHGHE